MISFKEYLEEATFNILPRNDQDIIHLAWLTQDARKILLLIYNNFEKWFHQKWADVLPLSLANNNNTVKFRRLFDINELLKHLKQLPELKNYNIQAKKNSFSIKEGNITILTIISGEGSRNRKAGGGQQGKEFEYRLANDLANVDNTNYVPTYPQIVKAIDEILQQNWGINIHKQPCEINVFGGRNQKRNLIWSNSGIKYIPEGDIGKIVQDINVKQGNKEAYLSLKYTSQYYIVNASIRQYLYLDKINQDVKLRNQFLKYLGFNPKQFCQPLGIVSNDDSQLSESKIMNNWAEILKQSLGFGYIFVWAESPMKFTVFDLNKWANVKIQAINGIKYIQPGIRKYAVISMLGTINDIPFKIDAQFRGTTSEDRYPYYMRVLLRH